MSDLADPARPGAGGRREAARLASARLRRGDADEGPSARELAFAKGADGEERLGTQLNHAAARLGGVAVLHDLVLPGKLANIDHLVIGPAGVTIVDAKAWEGRVWVGRAVIGQGRRGRRKPIEGMRAQLARVHQVLAPAGRDDLPVDAALCFVNNNDGVPPTGLRDLEGVLVGRPGAVIDWAMRPGRHDIADVLEVAELIQLAFEVNGGVSLPTEPRREAPSRLPHRPSPRRLAFPMSLVRGLAVGLCGLIILAIVCATVATLLQSAATSIAPPSKLSRRALNVELPRLRRLARHHSGRAVSTGRVTTHADRFLIRYRAGRSCRVVISVVRVAPTDADAPIVWTRGCRSTRPR
jgi:hypothetical protein